MAAIVFLVSFAYGVQELIIDRATGLDALRIIDVSTVRSQIVKLDDLTIQRFQDFSEVEDVEPLLNVPGKINYGGSSTDIVIFSASPEYLNMGSVKVDQGNYYSETDNSVIVNTAVLNLIGINEDAYNKVIGSKAEVKILLQEDLFEEGSTKESKTAIRELNIVGVIADTETPYVFLPFSILKEQGVVNYSQAKVKVYDGTQLETIRLQLESLGFSTSSAADTVDQIDQIFTIFRVILAAFGSIALVVSSLGMFNTLTVSLLERTREVGLMKALGAKKKVVFTLFLSESLLIAVVGGSLGILMGWLAGEGVNFLLNRLAIATGNESVDIFQTPVIFVVGIVLFSFVVGFLTGLYPSRRASSLNPLDALRFE